MQSFLSSEAKAQGSDFDHTLGDFRQRFVLYTSGGLFALMLVGMPILLSLGLLEKLGSPWGFVVMMATLLLAFYFARRGKTIWGGLCLVLSLVAANLVFLMGAENPDVMIYLRAGWYVAIVLAGFLTGIRETVALSLVISTIEILFALRFNGQGDLGNEPMITATVSVMGIVTVASALGIFTRQFRFQLEKLERSRVNAERLAERARIVSEGDLRAYEGETFDLLGPFEVMVASLRDTLGQVQSSSGSMASAALEISTMARSLEEGSVHQAGAITETMQQLDTLVDASREINGSARDVSDIASSALENSRLIENMNDQLKSSTSRIGEVLQSIRDIADRSEILALNASLEGVKAGEHGRGFTLVAGEMKGLAENVKSAVTDVRTLMLDVQRATDAASATSGETRALNAKVADASAEISAYISRQLESVEQVRTAMSEISGVSEQVASGSTQTLSATEQMAGSATVLQGLSERFIVDRLSS